MAALFLTPTPEVKFVRTSAVTIPPISPKTLLDADESGHNADVADESGDATDGVVMESIDDADGVADGGRSAV